MSAVRITPPAEVLAEGKAGQAARCTTPLTALLISVPFLVSGTVEAFSQGRLPLAAAPQSGSLDADVAFTKITTGSIVNDGGYSFGCAWGDYDGDGLIDLFVCNWGISGTQHDFLYHNLGKGLFERVTTGPLVNANANATGAAWADYDNDGKLDLFVTRIGVTTAFGPNTLYHNQGGGVFSKTLTGAVVTQSLRSHSGIWSDFDRDGFVDLVVVNFRVPNTTGTALDNYWYHNNGDGSFLQHSFGSKSASNGDSFDAAAADFNNDGWPDLVITQGASFSRQNSLLYLNQNGTLALQTNSAVFANPGNSIGCAWGDYDNDGFLDLFVTNFYGQNNYLFHNNGDGSFTLVTNSVATVDGGYSTGCAWGDYDNDGWLDLFVANVGPVDPNTLNSIAPGKNFLYHNNGDGTFTKITSGSPVEDQAYSIGAAWGDYDNDGFLDLFVSNGWITKSEKNALYHNDGNANNWIKFKLVGTVSNRSAIGAKVRLKATIGGKTIWQLREISGGSGHGCQNDLRANFGLGDASNIDLVQIEWPSGIVQTLTNVSAKQFLTITEHQASGIPPEFSGVSRDQDGVVTLSVRTQPGQHYLFEASTNLTDWIWLGQTSSAGETVEFTDRHSTNLFHRFYRASAP